MTQNVTNEHHWTLKTIDGKKSVSFCIKCGYITHKVVVDKHCTGFIDEAKIGLE